jgi:two-component system probable response regulator PhcQ
MSTTTTTTTTAAAAAANARDYKKFAVLYVDDEEQACKYFRKGMEKEFQVFTAKSVAEALEILARESTRVAAVITDQRMPMRTGVELLTEVRRHWPNMVRMLITAYADIDSAVAAVNSGAIYKYITKPADVNELRQTLRQALDIFCRQTEREALLREKMGVLQRVMVADRVRSLAALASGISHHFRNSMTAMSCFLEEAGGGNGEGPASDPADPERARYLDELWALAQKEREQLIQMVQRVGQTVVEPSCQFGDGEDIEGLIRRGIESAGPEVAAARVSVETRPRADGAALPRPKVDAELVVRLFKTLLTYAARLSPPDCRLRVIIEPAPADEPAAPAALRVSVRAEAPLWAERDVSAFFTPFNFPTNDPSDLGLDPLMAFFIAYHHGGDLLVHPAPPAGPSFELRLPLDPASARRPEWQDALANRLFAPPAAGGDDSVPSAA